MSDEVIQARWDRKMRWFRPRGPGRSQSTLWHVQEPVELEEYPMGAYPKGFLEWAARYIRVPRSKILHVCSGGLPLGEGIRVDVRPEMHPDVVADGRALPFPDNTFEGCLIDPPYSVENAEQFYQIDYPRPSQLLMEAGRVVKPCAPVGMLHWLVPQAPPRSGLQLEAIKAVTTGMGYRIRAFTVYRKQQEGLF